MAVSLNDRWGYKIEVWLLLVLHYDLCVYLDLVKVIAKENGKSTHPDR